MADRGHRDLAAVTRVAAVSPRVWLFLGLTCIAGMLLGPWVALAIMR